MHPSSALVNLAESSIDSNFAIYLGFGSITLIHSVKLIQKNFVENLQKRVFD